ncbi:hypothetical protein GGP41_004354 [Bipolaris sorokiniana]|uniref:Uncharacterized protein n=1 Tax=Cochliobolus sativus TaxID=45130 RepID=A0A8H6DYV4_COCSA|nr:hypothetical protein GGP41_004354 [Bipolaris sorokiniana]
MPSRRLHLPTARYDRLSNAPSGYAHCTLALPLHTLHTFLLRFLTSEDPVWHAFLGVTPFPQV